MEPYFIGKPLLAEDSPLLTFFEIGREWQGGKKALNHEYFLCWYLYAQNMYFVSYIHIMHDIYADIHIHMLFQSFPSGKYRIGRGADFYC